jgi:hypothetical protein
VFSGGGRDDPPAIINDNRASPTRSYIYAEQFS